MSAEPDGATWWMAVAGGISVSVRVSPGAARSELVAVDGDRLRLRIAAPALEGRANAELERVVARLFGVRRSAVSVFRGGHARDKTLRIVGITAPPAGFAASRRARRPPPR